MSQTTATASLEGPNAGLGTVIRVENIGTAWTGTQFFARLFAAELVSPACSAELGTVDEVLVPDLQAGEAVDDIEILGPVPVDSPMSLQLCVEVDSTGFVSESDETNNLAAAASPTVIVECFVDADCEQYLACSVDSCTDNVCSSSPVTCDDGDMCTSEYCDVTIDGCVYQPVSCDDGDACTVDRCESPQGCVAEPVVCDDGDPCTADACDSQLGCTFTPIECPPGVPVGGSGPWLPVLAALIGALGAFGVRKAARVGR